jgi:hypothetical protein
MEANFNKKSEKKEPDIVFSKTIVAGKRVYYIDVKRNKNGDLFVTITESKKILTGDDLHPVYYEKHKVFLYKEDFGKFLTALEETITYAIENNTMDTAQNRKKDEEENHPDEDEDNPIRLKIDF